MVGIVALILSMSFAQADTAFKIEDKKVTFSEYEKERLTISKNCREQKLKCKAYANFLRKSQIRLTKEDLVGGKNPGSVKCSRLGGVVVMGYDSDENENTFCKFSDNSFIDCGSL